MAGISKLIGKTTFIVGNKKNSGKTTFLNSALEKLRKKGKVAYLSIGVDGEVSDQIFGFPKPRVYAEPGDNVVTLETALENTQAKFRTLKTFQYDTVLGRPKLVQITSPGTIEIIGPENNSQLASILKFLHKDMKIRTILVDGAINRITQVSSFKDAQFVFICRVDPYRVESAADELKRMFILSKISSPKRRRGSGAGRDDVMIEGALTSTKALNLEKGDRLLFPKKSSLSPLIVEDFTKVFLDLKELQRFQRRHKLYFCTGFKLSFAVVNLFGVERSAFVRALSDTKLAKKLVFNEIGAK